MTTDRLRLPTSPAELARLRAEDRCAHQAWRGLRQALGRSASRG